MKTPCKFGEITIIRSRVSKLFHDIEDSKSPLNFDLIMTPTFDNFFLKLLWTLPTWWKFHHPFSGSSWEITLLLWHLWPLNFDPMTSKLNRFFLISLWRHPANLVRMRSFVLELADYFMIFKTSNGPNNLLTLTSWPQLLTISFWSYHKHIMSTWWKSHYPFSGYLVMKFI